MIRKLILRVAIPTLTLFVALSAGYDPNDLLKARDYIQTMSYLPGAWGGAPASDPSGGSDPNGITKPWTDIGPGNLGGRIRAMIIDPSSNMKLTVAGVAGGIWQSSDGGASWHAVNDILPNLAVTCMTQDKLNPSVMYAGTGESFAQAGDGAQGAGVFKSTDGGASWTRLASTNTFEWQFVNGLAVSPANSSVVLAAQANGLYRSTDAGATWTHSSITDFVADVRFDPNNASKVVASGYDGLAWFSTDGGATWAAAGGFPFFGRVQLAYAKGIPDLVYAVIDHDQGELFKSVNGGQTYGKIPNVNPADSKPYPLLDGLGAYDEALWADPTDGTGNTLIVGGRRLWITFDGGFSFSEMSAGTGIHLGNHNIIEAQDFASSHAVYFATDGGLYRANDYRSIGSTLNFESLNHGLGITLFYSGAGNVASGLIIGGSQDNGLPRYNGTLNGWQDVAQGVDCGYAAALGGTPGGVSTFFASYSSTVAVHDGISTFRIRLNSSGAPLSAPELLPNLPSGEEFLSPNSPLILDPNDGAGTLFKSSRKLFRYRDAANTLTGTWEMILDLTSVPGVISAIAVAQGNSNIIYVGNDNGTLWSTHNGDAAAGSITWTQLSGTPNRKCNRIVIDPLQNSRVYAVFDGFEDNVFKSENEGASWSLIVGSGSNMLPKLPVHTLVIDPLKTTSIYIGTELGVFGSDDRGATWSPPNGGPANVAVEELFWMTRDLVAATHGRGMSRTNIPAPPPPPVSVSLTAPANNAAFTGGANITVTASASSAAGIQKVEFFANGKKLGEDVLSPYSFSWKSVPIGNYALTAVATDNNSTTATSSAVNIKVTGGTISPRNPTADSYVRDGTNATKNFGTALTAQVKNELAGQVGNNRISYFKFSLSSIAGYVSKARLRVFGNLSVSTPADPAADVGVFSVSNTSWIESGTNSIIWNNKPAMAASPLSTAPMLVGSMTWHELDVTDYVRSQRAQGKTAISLALAGIQQTNSYFTLNTREAASNKPELSLSLVSPQALLVVGNATLVAGDVAISNRLKALGFTVVVKAASASVTGDATGKALVFISSTVSSSQVAAKFRTVTVPVVNCEEAVQDDMGMTGNITGGDRGTSGGLTQVVMQTSSHPLSAGLSGTQTVTTSASTFSWGVPTAAAVRISSIPGTPFSSEYAYEKDAPMVGNFPAPARRVHIFLTDAVPTVLTSAGWSLFDAAVIWASGF